MGTLALSHFLDIELRAEPAGRPAASPKGGYALGADMCGDGVLSFPRLRIGMRAGYCIGLVASHDDGLIFPRSIVQIPDSNLFVVADMGGWNPQQGRLLLLDPLAPDGKRIKPLVTHLDMPHGLAVGIDRRIYAGTAEKIFRFDPLAAKPEETVEVIVQGLPGLQPRLSDGTKLSRNFHPLKPFVFDRHGRLFVNVGAPTDSCAGKAPETKPCAAGEGAMPLAAVWMFTPPSTGIFPPLKAGDPNPAFEVFARGLRNSMALAAHPQFPDDGFPLLQAENARDLPDANRPHEELNILRKGKHYGWPYCYDLTTESPEYRAFLRMNTAYRNFCANTNTYQRPHSLMPPHAAPLGLFYYQADRFTELAGKLIAGLHGYRPTGGRIIFYDVDAKGLPTISPAPVHYNVSCARPSRLPFRTEQNRQIAAAPFNELVTQWYKVDGVRPQGAPVGMTVASDGAIWLVEDRNQTVLRIDRDPASASIGLASCDSRTQAEINRLANATTRDAANRDRLSQIRAELIEKHCAACHSGMGLRAGQTGRQKDEAVLRFLLAQDGWIYPGKPQAGRLHSRVWGKGADKIMPANGLDLLANDPSYRKVLETLDAFVTNISDTQPAGRR
jgi:glucose/arabinose dehydrogenase